MPSQLYRDLLDAFEEIASLEDNAELANEVKRQKSVMFESLGSLDEEQQLSEEAAKLKDKYNRVIDWYHRTIEKQSIPGEYDRTHPIIDEDLIARASNKFGFGSNKLRRALKGEDIWK